MIKASAQVIFEIGHADALTHAQCRGRCMFHVMSACNSITKDNCSQLSYWGDV